MLPSETPFPAFLRGLKRLRNQDFLCYLLQWNMCLHKTFQLFLHSFFDITLGKYFPLGNNSLSFTVKRKLT